MRKAEQNLLQKTTGTARSLQGNYTYNLVFDSVREAQKLADEIASLLPLMKKPFIVFPNRLTKRGLGLCHHSTGRIKLFAPKGQTVGVLLHELAHLHQLGWNEVDSTSKLVVRNGRFYRQRRIAHGRMFHLGHSEVHRVWEEQLKSKYMPKEGFGLSPSIVAKLWNPDVPKSKEVSVEKFFADIPGWHDLVPVEPNWEDMGRNAFNAGKKRIPVNDAPLMNALNEINKRVYNYSTKNALTLWLSGWDKANLEATMVTSPPVVVERKSRLSDADLELLRRRGRVPNGFNTVRS